MVKVKVKPAGIPVGATSSIVPLILLSIEQIPISTNSTKSARARLRRSAGSQSHDALHRMSLVRGSDPGHFPGSDPGPLRSVCRSVAQRRTAPAESSQRGGAHASLRHTSRRLELEIAGANANFESSALAEMASDASASDLGLVPGCATSPELRTSAGNFF